MKILHRFSVLFFVAAVAVFGLFRIHTRLTADTSGPEIVMEQDSISVSCTAPDSALLAGIRATDSRDGDVTASLVVEKLSPFLPDGSRTATIAAFDRDNHVTKTTRKIVYTDYVPPRFGLEKPLRFPLNYQNILEGLTVTDVLDGDLHGSVKISAETYLTENEAGVYSMVFTVTNSAGDTVSLPATVEIYNTTDESRNPQIFLSEYLVYTPVGQPIDPWEYVEKIKIGGEFYTRRPDGTLQAQAYGSLKPREPIREQDVQISQGADWKTPGVYEIIYWYGQETEYGIHTGTVRLIVVVQG